uniref:PaRXLR74 n=1 Tax=Phytophthora agathidicida TaxID=1642459 RepID=A0A7G4WI63_9STRA|nr:PaRXLR74 [Phytophthora agathidicida]
MRFTLFLAVFMVAFVTNNIDITSAESAAKIKIVPPASETELINVDNKVRRLRGSPKLTKEEEERAVLIAPVLAAHIVGMNTRLNGAQVSTTVSEKNAKKAAAALLVAMFGPAILVGGYLILKPKKSSQ